VQSINGGVRQVIGVHVLARARRNPSVDGGGESRHAFEIDARSLEQMHAISSARSRGSRMIEIEFSRSRSLRPAI
jgi:hypothetical protein